MALKLLDWSNSLKVSSFHESLLPEVEQVIAELKLDNNFTAPFDLFHLPKEKGLQLEYETPDWIVLKPMGPEHAKVVNDLWHYHHHSSEFFVRRLIERNYNVGAFCSKTNELLGWMLTFASGCHGLLQVDSNHLRKGIGKLIIKKMTKDRALKGLDSYAFISDNNLASRRAFLQLGFENIGMGHWIHTKELKPFVWED